MKHPKPKAEIAIKRSEEATILSADLALKSLSLLLLLDLQQQRAIDVWEDTTKGDSRTDECVKLLITTDGELKVTRGDALDLEVLGGVLFDMISKLGLGRSRTVQETREGIGLTHSGELEDFGGEILKDGGHIDGSLGSDTHLVLGVVLKEALDTSAWEL